MLDDTLHRGSTAPPRPRFARRRCPTPSAAPPSAPAGLGDRRRRGRARRDLDAAPPHRPPGRSRQAHAAFRSVEGCEQAALDAALAVLESEVARLRDAVWPTARR